MLNKEYTQKHIASAEYHRDYALNDAYMARRAYRRSGSYESCKLWKASVAEAWRMRAIVRSNRASYKD